MKSNKGITLTSLIIYVIVFCFVIGTVSMFTQYFSKNLDETVISVNTPEQYSKLTSYLTDDFNSENLEEIYVNDSNKLSIDFSDGTTNQYIYDNNQIYYVKNNNSNVEKKIKLCSNITNCEFDYKFDRVKMSITIDGTTHNNRFSVEPTKEEIDAFNRKFKPYEGENISASEVNELLQKAMDINEQAVEDDVGAHVAFRWPSVDTYNGYPTVGLVKIKDGQIYMEANLGSKNYKTVVATMNDLKIWSVNKNTEYATINAKKQVADSSEYNVELGYEKGRVAYILITN